MYTSMMKRLMLPLFALLPLLLLEPGLRATIDQFDRAGWEVHP